MDGQEPTEANQRKRQSDGEARLPEQELVEIAHASQA